MPSAVCCRKGSELNTRRTSELGREKTGAGKAEGEQEQGSVRCKAIASAAGRSGRVGSDPPLARLVKHGDMEKCKKALEKLENV